MLALDFFCDKHWFYYQEQPLAFFSNICRLCGDGSESCKTRHCFAIRFASFAFPLPFMCRCCLSEQKQKQIFVVIQKQILVVAKAGAKVDVERLRNVDRVLYWDEDCSDLGGRVKTLATFLNLGAEVIMNILRDLGGISF